MRVMHVIEAMRQGGAESLVVEHVARAGRGVTPYVCALNQGGPALEQVRETGVAVRMLGKGGGRLAGLRALSAWMRAERIDVVNGHNPTGGLYGALAARLAGVPVVFRTEHSIHYAGRHSRAYPALEALSTALSDQVVCVCEASTRSHVRRLGWARSRYVTVFNGISDARPARARDAVRASLGIGDGQPLALTVGSLTPQKSQDVLLRAFDHVRRQLPEARLLVAGEGRLEAELRALHAALALGDHVRFLGPRLDVADLVEACDVFVLSSSREGLSVTLLEAMRGRRACVATAIGGNPEAVEHGVTGCIVPAGEPTALGEALARLLADATTCTAFGAAGRARWERLFTAERMVRETESLYRAKLAARGRHPGPADGNGTRHPTDDGARRQA